ncbi:hypothetical protein GCM10015536_45570 [Streptomyces griseomycini]|nr:hypothetical protein GCM10015536_45570 [Streptomyces griseomycini]
MTIRSFDTPSEGHSTRSRSPDPAERALVVPDTLGTRPGKQSQPQAADAPPPTGPGGRGSRQERAVTITAEPSVRRAEHQDLRRRVVVHTAQASGHVQAEAGLLQHGVRLPGACADRLMPATRPVWCAACATASWRSARTLAAARASYRLSPLRPVTEPGGTR